MERCISYTVTKKMLKKLYMLLKMIDDKDEKHLNSF